MNVVRITGLQTNETTRNVSGRTLSCNLLLSDSIFSFAFGLESRFFVSHILEALHVKKESLQDRQEVCTVMRGWTDCSRLSFPIPVENVAVCMNPPAPEGCTGRRDRT